MSKCQRSNTDDNTGLIIAVGHQTFTGQCKNWALDWTGLDYGLMHAFTYAICLSIVRMHVLYGMCAIIIIIIIVDHYLCLLPTCNPLFFLLPMVNQHAIQKFPNDGSYSYFIRL